MIDSLLHLLACYAVVDFAYNFLPRYIGKDEYWKPIIPKLIAMGIGCLVGAGKELWDLTHGGYISASDVTMDLTGIFAWLFIPLIGGAIYKEDRNRALLGSELLHNVIFKINFVSIIKTIRWWRKKRNGVSSREIVDNINKELDDGKERGADFDGVFRE